MATGQPTKQLGALLVQRGLLTSRQLAGALVEQRTTKEFLGAILIRRRLIEPTTLLEALSEQFGIPHESLTPEQVDWRVVQQFPVSAISEGKCFPVRADAQSVTVAIANPLDVWTLSTIERAAGFRAVNTVLVLEQELKLVLQVHRQRMLDAIEARCQHGSDQTRQ